MMEATRRKDDGTWSPPSGILLHTAGLGFLAGIDIYDCVVVINTASALAAFTKLRCTLGGEVSAVAGPVGMGGILETEIHKRQAPVWTYLKSRGFYAGVQVDGTVIIERSDENERFYGERIKVADILAGKARIVPLAVSGLMNTLRMAQGEQVEEGQVPDGETPGDLELVEEKDSDPLGVHALEAEGIEIKEAGTGRRPSVDEFEPHLSPRSATFRVSTEASRTRSNSKATQTDLDTEDSLKKGEAVGEDGNVEKEQKLRSEPVRPGSSLEDATDAQGVNVVVAS